MMRNFLYFLIILGIFSSCSKSSGTFTDHRDGRKYKWIKIGNDKWMAENLAYLPQVNSVTEASLDDAKYYIFDYEGHKTIEAKSFETLYWNDSTIIPYKYFGVLYNWEAIVGKHTNNKGRVQGVCPSGWHIPTDEEWKKLELSLGMDSLEVDAIGLRNNNLLGFNLKADYGWNNSGNGTNAFGFAALPAGEAFSGVGFQEVGEKVTYWTATEGLFKTTAWTRSVLCCEPGILRIERDKIDGFALRCVKD